MKISAKASGLRAYLALCHFIRDFVLSYLFQSDSCRVLPTRQSRGGHCLAATGEVGQDSRASGPQVHTTRGLAMCGYAWFAKLVYFCTGYPRGTRSVRGRTSIALCLWVTSSAVQEEYASDSSCAPSESRRVAIKGGSGHLADWATADMTHPEGP